MSDARESVWISLPLRAMGTPSQESPVWPFGQGAFETRGWRSRQEV